MKRFHVDRHVDDLARNIAFSSRLFGAESCRVEADCAKWLLEDPRIDFAISTRDRARAGLDHLGLQVEDAAEQCALKVQAEAADMGVLDEGEATCRHARGEKHWTTDPQGVAWAHFRPLGDVPLFDEGMQPEASATCCAPESAVAASCCGPASSKLSCR